MVWEEPLVIEPKNGVHKYTLVYLHPYAMGLRGYIRKTALFTFDGLRVVMPSAPTRNITCLGHRPMKAWYDYLSDCGGAREEEVGEASLADSRQHLFSLLDREALALSESEGYVAMGNGSGHDGLIVGGLSQGCCTALDVAIRYQYPIRGFVGIVGHPLSLTPPGRHLEVPLHFFNGAKDKVMRWQWVEPLIDRLRTAGHRKVTVHGPLPGVHHAVTREFEASCLRTALADICEGFA